MLAPPLTLPVEALENPKNFLSDGPLFVMLLPVEQGVTTVA
ncbi:MAG: hypothetical protein Q7W05_09195 [Deltaproteobacteria bacterium]|nr:hypothetical protein [Deltaproteobacteria bacterium]